MLLSNILISILLPMTLSVEGYGQYRQYILYIGYIAILNFGFIDGIYIKYGGKDLKSNSKEIRQEHKFLIYFQSIITIIMVSFSILIDDKILLLLSFSIIPLNIGGFHKILYQSTGQFSLLSKVNIFFSVFNLIFVGALMQFNIENAFYYIFSTLLAHTLILLITEYHFIKTTKEFINSSNIKYLEHFKVGIFILLANLSILLFNNMGTWIVNIFLSIQKFASYSFAMSMLNMILITVSSVGLTFYNFLARNEDIKIIKLTKNILIILGALAGNLFFFLKFFIIQFIPKYTESLEIIAISLVNLPYIMIINVIINNLYKARKKERKFLWVVLKMLFVSFLLNILFYKIFNSLEMIALASTISFIFWYFYCINTDFKFIKSGLKEISFLVLHFILFLGCANFLNLFLGWIIYFVLICIFIFFFFYKDMKGFLIILKNNL